MSINYTELYKEWLRGSSLRAIAQRVGMHHGSLHGKFRKMYGMGACSLRAKSLIRSVIEDYEGDEDIITWALSIAEDSSKDYFKSNHSLQQLSNYQTLREEYIIDTVESTYMDGEDVAYWEFLRLPLYLLVMTSTSHCLEAVLYHNWLLL